MTRLPGRSRHYLAATLAVGVGCALSTSPSTNGVRATKIIPGIAVTNPTAQPIYTLAAERGALALLDWMPCSAPVCAPTALAGETATIPWSRVAGGGPRGEHVLYWWHAGEGDGRYVPWDSVRTISPVP